MIGRMTKRNATRRKHRALRQTHRKKKAVRWPANTGTVFHAANTEPTGRNWYSWTSAATALKQDHFRKAVPKGSSRAITAPWINSLSYIRGSLARNYPSKVWTRSRTRISRSSAKEALRRAEMLAEHLLAIEEGRKNGLGATVALNGPEEAEYQALDDAGYDQGGRTPEQEARFQELRAMRFGQ